MAQCAARRRRKDSYLWAHYIGRDATPPLFERRCGVFLQKKEGYWGTVGERKVTNLS
jgi:hypothetical protein